ncbi:MAG: thiamine kinase [Arenicella sp.]|jgi:thiamine kinase
MPDNTHIDQIMFESDIDWRAWPIVGPPKISSRFESGLNHRTLLIASGGKQYVLKVFESPAPMAIAAQRWAAKRALAAKVVYAPNDGRYLLMDFLNGEELVISEPDIGNIKAIAELTKALHDEAIDQTGIACGYFNYHAYCERYLHQCDAQIHKLHHSIRPALDIFSHDQTPLCICHNDLVLSNCLLDDGKALLLDWEFAQINNPWFDLASIIYYWQLNATQSRAFLAANHTDLEEQHQQPIFYAAQCAVLWLDILWHLDKFGPGHYSKLTEKIDHLKELTQALEVHLNI